MAKKLNMYGFDELTGDIEEFLNKKGFTLGKDAERLQKLLFCIQYCYLHGVVTDSQARQMNKKFMKKFQNSLKEMDNLNMTKQTINDCSFIKECVLKGLGEPSQNNGQCAGYQKSEIDDEPCEKCINCELNEFYEEE